jgi:Uma2 family endonuclease
MATGKKASFVDGAPLIAVEVLSPYDKQIDIFETIEEYLDCGVQAVWIVNPYDDTVNIHRLGREPECLTFSDAIENQPELPGFRCSVAELFQ